MSEPTNPKPVFHADGSVSVPAFALPVSDLVSNEAAAAQCQRVSTPIGYVEAVDVTPVTTISSTCRRAATPSRRSSSISLTT